VDTSLNGRKCGLALFNNLGEHVSVTDIALKDSSGAALLLQFYQKLVDSCLGSFGPSGTSVDENETPCPS